MYEHVSGVDSVPFKYNWPGIIATLALILINLVSRDDLAEISNSGDPGDDVRLVTVICWLVVLLLLLLTHDSNNNQSGPSTTVVVV